MGSAPGAEACRQAASATTIFSHLPPSTQSFVYARLCQAGGNECLLLAREAASLPMSQVSAHLGFLYLTSRILCSWPWAEAFNSKNTWLAWMQVQSDEQGSTVR